jgi:hypothetical protein
MDRFPQLGRFLFAIPFATFGIQYFLYGHYAGGLSPVPPWAPGGAIGARLAALLLGPMFLSWTVLLRAPLVATHLNNGDERTSAFVALALCGASFLLPPLFPKRT